MKTSYILSLFIAIWSLSSCSETDYPVFDDSVIDIYFNKDSMNYSFGVVALGVTEHTIDIPVKIIGAAVSEDRSFLVEVVSGRSNAKSPDQYTIPTSLVLPADSVNCTLPVTIYRNTLDTLQWAVAFRLIANEHFTPTSEQEEEISNEAIVTFNNIVSKPNWVDRNGNFDWPETKLGPWNPTVYVVFMDFFRRMEQTAPATYRNLVERWGENLDQTYNDGWGTYYFGSWDYEYDLALTKFVLIPMYEYFQEHPELGVTDFPNPNE
ncbi:MAG: DUF4843 domain-containing protein [Odoribacter splanchnicus]